jgi:bile acid:Na+ symporter, BASS family
VRDSRHSFRMTVRRLPSLLTNRTFILVSAFVAGLFFSDLAARMGPLTMPALAVVLTVSTTQVSAREFLPPGSNVRPVLTALLLNFVLLGSLILLLAWWLMPTQELWVGYVLVATAPPGIAIIPFTYVLKGNLRLSFQGTFGAYLVCLVLTPALVYLFTGVATVSPLRLFSTMLPLILIPFITAQGINISRAAPYVARWRGTIINWGFFVVIFTVVGLNQQVFLRQHRILLAVSVPAIISSFGLAFLVDLLGKRSNLDEATRNSYILLSTIKTSAFAAAVGLSLYGEASSIPGAVVSAWYALYFIFLGIKGSRAGSPA